MWVCRYNEKGTLMLSCGTDSLVKVWDAHKAKAIATLSGSQQCTMICEFSPDDRLVMAAGNDKTARLWSMDTARIQHTLLGHSNKIYAGTFSYDSLMVYTGSHDRTIRSWDIENGKSAGTTNCQSSCNYISRSPNGNLLASAHLDHAVRVWAPRSMELVHEIEEAHTQQVTCAEFSSDGGLVVTNSRDGTIKLFDSRTWQLIKELRGTKDRPYRTGVNWVSVLTLYTRARTCAPVRCPAQ